MKAADAIASLDKRLMLDGQTVVVRKTNAATPSATVMAFVRGVKAEKIDGTTIKQSDKTVVLSPTGLDSIGIPSEGWLIVFDNAPHALIGKPEIIRLADVVVRINAVVKG